MVRGHLRRYHFVCRWAGVLAIALVATIDGQRASFAATTFVIDPSSSFLTISGEVPGVGPLLEQAPGTLETAFAGTIEVDLDTPGFISFPGGGLADFFVHPGIFEPGGLPADFAGLIEDVPPTDETAFLTLRDLTFDSLGPPVPLALDGSFPVDSMLADILGGLAEIELGAAFLGLGTGGVSIPNESLALGSLEVFGQNFVLSVPFEAETSVVGTPAGTVELLLTGELVAFAPIPEPATLVLLAIGTVAFCAIARRSRPVA